MLKDQIEKKLTVAFAPQSLTVINESHMHNVPVNAETHFKVIIVSDRFEGLARVKRQQAVYSVLQEELAGSLHALSMQTLTLEESENHVIPSSPQCMGGGTMIN